MDKDAFFAAAALPRGTVELPGFGVVQIQSLTMAERLEMPERFREDAGKTAAWIVARGVDGLDDDDIPDIMRMDPDAIDKVGDAILKLSGLGGEDEAKKD